MKFRMLAAFIIAVPGLLSGCGNKEEEAKQAAAAKLVAQQAETEKRRIDALTPEQRAKEESDRACQKAKAQFAECEKMTGNAYVNCIASMSVPEGCGSTTLDDMRDHANGTVKHQ